MRPLAICLPYLDPVADFLAAIGPIVTKEAQLCVSKLLQSQLADKHWVVVHTALSSVFRYSSTSRIAVPAFPPTSRELMVGFIQNMPFKVGLGESQVRPSGKCLPCNLNLLPFRRRGTIIHIRPYRLRRLRRTLCDKLACIRHIRLFCGRLLVYQRKLHQWQMSSMPFTP